MIGILAIVCLILFFTFEFAQADQEASQGISRIHPFGFLSDVLPIFSASAALVVVVVLFQLERESAPQLSVIAALLGIVGNLIMAAGSILFVLNRITLSQQTQLFFIAFAPLGLWQILVSYLARHGSLLLSRLTRSGIVVGLGQIVGFLLMFVLDGYNAMVSSSPTEMIASVPILISVAIGLLTTLIGYIGSPVWLIWLGRVLVHEGHQSGAINTHAGAPDPVRS